MNERKQLTMRLANSALELILRHEYNMSKTLSDSIKLNNSK